MSALWLSLALALAAAPPPTAPKADPPAALQNPGDALRQAKNSFDYGSYEPAAKLAEQLIATHALERPQDQIESYRLLGLARFFLHQNAAAQDAFLNLLSLDPDYQLDPFYVPPQAIAFFEGVRSQNQALLQPIRERRRAAQEALRAEEEARQKLLSQAKAPPEEPKVKVVNVRVERHNPALALLPLGVGQFQNGNPKLAWGLLVSEAALAGTSFGTFWWIQFKNGTLAPSQNNSAAIVRDVSNATGGAFFALWAFGIGEALWHFNSTVTVREEEAPAQPAKPAPPPKASLNFAPLPGGGMANLALRY